MNRKEHYRTIWNKYRAVKYKLEYSTVHHSTAHFSSQTLLLKISQTTSPSLFGNPAWAPFQDFFRQRQDRFFYSAKFMEHKKCARKSNIFVYKSIILHFLEGILIHLSLCSIPSRHSRTWLDLTLYFTLLYWTMCLPIIIPEYMVVAGSASSLDSLVGTQIEIKL